MESEYAEQYRRLASEHWWWRARRGRILPVISRYAPPAAAILDVGCAGGVLFPYLGQIGEAWGIEPDPALVSDDNEFKERIHVGYLDSTYRAPRKFNVVLFLDVLEHLDDPVGALRLAAQHMASGGTVIATVPAFRWLWSSHDVINLHRTRYTQETIADVARAAGFRVEESAYFFHWTVPLMWARTVMEKIRAPKPSPPMLPPPIVNKSFEWLSRMEFRWLSPLRLPFGSSVLVVLRRSD